MEKRNREYKEKLKTVYRKYVLTCTGVFASILILASIVTIWPPVFNLLFIIGMPILIGFCISSIRHISRVDKKELLSKWNYLFLGLALLPSSVLVITSLIVLISRFPSVHFSHSLLLCNYHLFLCSFFILLILFLILYTASLFGGIYKPVGKVVIAGTIFLFEFILGMCSTDVAVTANLAFLGLVNIVFNTDNFNYFVPKKSIFRPAIHQTKDQSKKIQFYSNLYNVSFSIFQVPLFKNTIFSCIEGTVKIPIAIVTKLIFSAKYSAPYFVIKPVSTFIIVSVIFIFLYCLPRILIFMINPFSYAANIYSRYFKK